ncbi:unnamed protein product [Gongylonema pulchrum]|uniref:Uncharacterized protein n=1 Tax=Gongylonema pulchrum TaxID=637853 RepID=A0A3P7NU85_9BILA|nr:unnamed protein product [Gongylonema pulchrum]
MVRADYQTNQATDKEIDYENDEKDYGAAESEEWAFLGSEFIKEMIAIANSNKVELAPSSERVVQFVSQPIFGTMYWRGAPAQFGKNLDYKAVSIGNLMIRFKLDGQMPLFPDLSVAFFAHI